MHGTDNDSLNIFLVSLKQKSVREVKEGGDITNFILHNPLNFH